jgi:hypothetical protein
VIFSARALNVSRVVMDGLLDVSLDVLFGVLFGLDFGRNTCSGYTTFTLSSLAVTGARQARIAGLGVALSFGGGAVALRSSPRSMPRSM